MTPPERLDRYPDHPTEASKPHCAISSPRAARPVVDPHSNRHFEPGVAQGCYPLGRKATQIRRPLARQDVTKEVVVDDDGYHLSGGQFGIVVIADEPPMLFGRESVGALGETQSVPALLLLNLLQAAVPALDGCGDDGFEVRICEHMRSTH